MADFELQGNKVKLHVTRSDSLEGDKISGRTYYFSVIANSSTAMFPDKAEGREDNDCMIFLKGMLDNYFNHSILPHFHGEIISGGGLVSLVDYYLEKSGKSVGRRLESNRLELARWLLRHQQDARHKTGQDEFGRLYNGLEDKIRVMEA